MVYSHRMSLTHYSISHSHSDLLHFFKPKCGMYAGSTFVPQTGGFKIFAIRTGISRAWGRYNICCWALFNSDMNNNRYADQRRARLAWNSWSQRVNKSCLDRDWTILAAKILIESWLTMILFWNLAWQLLESCLLSKTVWMIKMLLRSS